MCGDVVCGWVCTGMYMCVCTYMFSMYILSVSTQVCVSFCFGASLSKPHLVCSMAGSAMYVCSRTFNCHIFCCGCPLQFCTHWYAYCYTGRKWLPLANVSHFLYRVLEIITMPTEMKEAVQPCPPSIIYAEKSKIRAATAVLRLCAAVSGHTLMGLVEAWQ